jgi:hypothetical protein
MIALSIFAGQCLSHVGAIASPGDDLDIYLLIGQSNMAGRAPLSDELREPIGRVFLFTGEPGNEWIPARNPLNLYSTIRKQESMQQLGPGHAFARRMTERQTDRRMGLVVNARGGTAIREWLPGTEYFSEAVARVRQAAAHGRVRGILWHQGEGDVSRVDAYLEDLAVLIRALRDALNDPDLPFVAGQLSEDNPRRIPFNAMLVALPARVPRTGVALSNGTSTFDGTHFDARSQVLLGERYADEMLRLQELPPAPAPGRGSSP